MRLLIADDDAVSLRTVAGLVESWGFEYETADDGHAAWKILLADNPPDVAVLDWMMPGLEGVEVCRRVRQERPGTPIYIILLTAKRGRGDLVGGLDAGADDYLVKPFNADELSARVRAGARIVGLQKELMAQVTELKATLADVRRLSGLLPICCYCKSIRDDSDYWHEVEEYVAERSAAHFSHGICPKCLETVMKENFGDQQDK